MHRILVTAFEPFLHYPINASQEILQHWLQDNPGSQRSEFVAEILPVDFDLAESRLVDLHAASIDFAIHLGQSPKIDCFNLELVALNLKSGPETAIARLNPLGPTAYASHLPLEEWCEDLREHELPAKVSFHAGTYLCNAAYFWSTEAFMERGVPNRSLFVHVPLLPEEEETRDAKVRQGSRMLTRLLHLIEGHLELDQEPAA